MRGATSRPLRLQQGRRVAEGVLRQTTSGGACVNICALQGALPSLGFGGIGQSGSGRHHGIEGFREFSNPRGVVVRGTGDLADAFLPPYGATAQAIVDQRVRPSRPTRRPRPVPGPDPMPASSLTQSAGGPAGRPARRRRRRPSRYVLLAARWVHEGRRLDMQGLADELGVSRATCSAASAAAKRCSATPWRSSPTGCSTCAAARWEAQRPAGELHTPGTGRTSTRSSPVQGPAPPPRRRTSPDAAGAHRPAGPGATAASSPS